MITELLSPAKDKETAFEAINCGADAIYIGALNYGARRNATNSIEDIEAVVNYAHKFWAKVYVTVNTILTDDEITDAISLIKKLDEIGADAVIVQDMGLLEKISTIQEEFLSGIGKSSISIPIHISTQCDNRDLEKVDFFNKIGISRVVLARELSLKQIKEIHAEVPNIEIESFVHGALCVSYSGQCYLSHYIGGRSANRGECAQPCRKKYSVVTKDGKVIAKDIYALCLKDFNASKHIEKMIEAGVYSFKIEGRLKDSNYVKNVTAYYRHELDKYSTKSSSGHSIQGFTPNPYKSFNRGFTDYFLEKRSNCFNFVSPKSRGEYLGKIVKISGNKFVIKTKSILHPQDGLTNGKEGALVNKVDKGAIFFNRQVNFKIGDNIYRNVDSEFEKDLLNHTRRVIDTRIEIKNNVITAIDEDGIDVSIEINKTEQAKNREKMLDTFNKQFKKTGDTIFSVTDIKIQQELPFIPISKLNEIRRSLFNKLETKRLAFYSRENQKPLKFSPYYKKELDYKANVYNKYAKSFYEKCGAFVKEPALELEIPKHAIELMRTKHCIKYALGMCKSPLSLYLKDEVGKAYPLIFDCKKCEMVILNQ